MNASSPLRLVAVVVGTLGLPLLSACSHSEHAQSAHDTTTAPATQTADTSAALPFTTREPTTGDDEPMTPASGFATPRTNSASSAPTTDSAPKTETSFDQGSSIEDQRSIQEIREALAADRSIAAPARQVTITARDGRVTLRGQVNTAEQRASIEKAARRAGGVIEVRNNIVVLE